MKLYAVMYFLDTSMDPSDACLCYETYGHYMNDGRSDPCIYQNKQAADEELKRQVKKHPMYPHAVFEMSNEIMSGVV